MHPRASRHDPARLALSLFAESSPMLGTRACAQTVFLPMARDGVTGSFAPLRPRERVACREFIPVCTAVQASFKGAGRRLSFRLAAAIVRATGPTSRPWMIEET